MGKSGREGKEWERKDSKGKTTSILEPTFIHFMIFMPLLRYNYQLPVRCMMVTKT